MSRYRILGLGACAVFVALLSQPTVRGDHLPEIEPVQTVQMSDDPATLEFIRIYLSHGSQFDPK